MIPRTIHQVWVGPREIPAEETAWAATWKEYNPDWTLVLWTDDPDSRSGPWDEIVRVGELVNSHSLHRLHEVVQLPCRGRTERAYLAALSDVIRMEVIAREGGVYADLDVECFRPIDSLLEGVSLFCADECGPCCGNYLFGAPTNHPALWTCVRELQLHLADLGPGTSPVIATGPAYLNSRLRRHLDLVLFPWPLFNPLWAWFNPSEVQNWPRVSYGNHHYAGRWYKRKKRRPPAPFAEAIA